MKFDLTPQLPTTFDLAHILLAGIVVILFIALIAISSKRNSNNASAASGKPEATASVAAETLADKPVQSTAASIREPSADSALQFLSSLQQEARLIDFVQEDIGNYSDAEVGAAARVVHEGSKKAITDFFTLSPIREEEEESRVTLPEGFNASEVRLTGNVVGAAPFSGTLIHRGWRVKEVKLPKLSAGHDTTIVAPAEVEL